MKEIRLHDVITPNTYAITLTPDLVNFTFSGEETIELTLKKKTTAITLHAVALEIREASLEENGEKLEAAISYNKKTKTCTFTFSQEITPGEKKLHITFTGIIGEQLKGWYKSAYTVSGKQKYLVTSHFEEIGARQVFPCIDDPAAKAVFIITLIVPKDLVAISNTIPSSIQTVNEYKVVTFTPTPKMSTYSLAMIVGEFESIEEKSKTGVLVKVSVTPEKKHLATFALKTAVNMLSFYEEYFDIAYPLPQLDLIAIPDFDAGAMENWGAITAREAALLIDEEKSASMNKQWVATVIAHEIVHMWFGNLVTLEWWTYLWLNEGFASYMEYMALAEFFPQWQVWEQFAVLDHNRALGLDSLEHTHPVEVPVTDLDKLTENFDEISYSKGASVIYMLAAYLGEEDFKQGIRSYLKKHAYANATTEDLWEALEKSSGKPVKQIMHEFVTSPGHPIISAEILDTTLSLHQKRFFINPRSKKESTDKTIWNIPFAVVSSHALNEKEFLLESKTMSLPVKNLEWLKINRNETSYVRSIYSKELYSSLEKPIRKKVLSSIDRMGILRDAFDGAEGDYLATDFALKLVGSYTEESSYIVWAALAGKLAKIANLLSDTDLVEEFDSYARSIFSHIGKELGWKKRSSNSHTDILLRSVVLYALGTYGDKETIAKAQELFSQFINNKKPIDNDIRGLVYRLVAENGHEKEFTSLEELYISESLHEEKNRISSALCSFKDVALMQRALDFSLSENVRLQDIGRFIMLGFDNAYGRKTTWEFVKEHWDYLAKKHEGQLGMSWLIEGAGAFTSEAVKQDFERFFTAHPTPQLTRTIQQVIEQIETKVAWLSRDYKAIKKFLTNNF